MAKYIDIESLVIGYSGHTPDDEFSKGVNFVLDLLDSKPPEAVKPVAHGKWISKDKIFGGIPFACSSCGEETRDTVMGKPRFRYCPMCGLPMCGAFCGGDEQ